MVSRGIIVRILNISDPNAVSMSQDERITIAEFQKQAKVSTNTSATQQRSLKKYIVRVPLIHGILGDASAVPDSQLPEATYCPLPGSQETELRVGDLVYTAIVDFKFDDLVIIGLIPNQQSISESGLSLKRVNSLELTNDATFRTNKLTISTNDGTVTEKNLMALDGFNSRLRDYVWPIKNGGTGVDGTSESGKKQFRDNLGLYTTRVVSSAEFEQLQKDGNLEKFTVYYIYQGDNVSVENTKAIGGGRSTVTRVQLVN